MRTLAIVNLKGGTGKTVSAANMAHILAALHRKKVLLVDGDKQGSVSQYFRVYGEHDGTAALLELPTARDRKAAREKRRAMEQATAARFRQYRASESAWAAQKRTGPRRREWRGPWRGERTN